MSRHEWHSIQTEKGGTKKEKKPGRIMKGGAKAPAESERERERKEREGEERRGGDGRGNPRDDSM